MTSFRGGRTSKPTETIYLHHLVARNVFSIIWHTGVVALHQLLYHRRHAADVGGEMQKCVAVWAPE